MEQETNTSYITKLPNEIIAYILRNNNCHDIINFGSTCKKFNTFINSYQNLWKQQLKSIIPKYVFQAMSRFVCEYDWFQEVKNYHLMRQKIHHEIARLPSRCPDLGVTSSIKCAIMHLDPTTRGVNIFFDIASSSNVSYPYSIHILQNLIKKGNALVDKNLCVTPFTMTEIYYAKTVLDHLWHALLYIQWVQKLKKAQLTPEVVLHIFIRWMDVERFHSEEVVEEKILEIVNEVEALLSDIYSTSATSALELREKVAKKLISEKTVLNAITEVIYHHRGMTVTHAATLETFDMEQVLVNNSGNAVSVAVIYYYVAKRCGVRCEVIPFPYHCLLEWRDTSHEQYPKVYTIDLYTGMVQEQRTTCPSVSRNIELNSYRPVALLQCFQNVYTELIDNSNQRASQISLLRLFFMERDSVLFTIDKNRTYYRYRSFLKNYSSLAILADINFNYIEDEHLRILSLLSNLSRQGVQHIQNSHMVKKKRDSSVKYAVGMICYHKEYRYSTVIVGWDLTCNDHWERYASNKGLKLGQMQPFYSIISGDQTRRYIAQEHLMDITQTSRLHYIEDVISRYFTHFNGFAYVPNKTLSDEYPDDYAISEMFRSRAESKTGIVF